MMLEAMTLRMFSYFFSVLGVLVLIGSIWSFAKTSTLLASLVTGVTLLLVAVGCGVASHRLHRRLNQHDA